MNALLERYNKIVHICEHTSRGIWKRIDENRELLDFLYEHAPELLERFPFLRGWIAQHDEFFVELAKAAGTDNIFDREKYGADIYPRQYPRPWPHAPANSLSLSEHKGEQ